MYDSDGPLIAKSVYQALFPQQIVAATQRQTCPTHKGFHTYCDNGGTGVDQELHPEESCGSQPQEINSSSRSLAEVIDDAVRYMRLVKKVPAERWATFVHIGI